MKTKPKPHKLSALCATALTTASLLIVMIATSTAQAVPESTTQPPAPKPEWPKISVRYFVVTAPTSPSNSFCLQNLMSHLEPAGGYIAYGFSNNPTAVNQPNTLRVCDITYTPLSYGSGMWDATNNPTGAFTNQNGKRLAWVFDWSDTNAFLASAIYFRLWSDEPANSLAYPGNLNDPPGNIATNAATGLPLVFSSLLRGELWVNGHTNSYSNGELIATHPVNRVYGMVRLGYYCNNPTELGLTLNYFKTHMNHIASHAAFFMLNGVGMTNVMSSRHFINPPVLTAWVDGWGCPKLSFTVYIEGQRQLGLSYSLKRSDWLADPCTGKKIPEGNWDTIATGLPDGVYLDPENHEHAFYASFEDNIPVQTQTSFSARAAMWSEIPPAAVISNGDE